MLFLAVASRQATMPNNITATPKATNKGTTFRARIGLNHSFNKLVTQ